MYNPYFHKKIFIDKNGDVKNSFHSDVLCNITDIGIDSIFDDEKTTKYWMISKDKINVCKDCENRYACYDNRLPQQHHGEAWFYSSNCHYNPYICKWKGQESYVPVEECGTYSQETGYIPDHEKIKALNRQIWGEEEGA